MINKTIIILLIILSQLKAIYAGEIIDQICGVNTPPSSILLGNDNRYYTVLPNQKLIVAHFPGTDTAEAGSFRNMVSYNFKDKSYSRYYIYDNNNQPLNCLASNIIDKDGNYSILIGYNNSRSGPQFSIIDINAKKEIAKSQKFSDKSFDNFGFIGDKNDIMCFSNNKFYIFNFDCQLIDSISNEFGKFQYIYRNNNYIIHTENGKLYKYNYQKRKFEYLMDMLISVSIRGNYALSADCSQLAYNSFVFNTKLIVCDLITKKTIIKTDENVQNVAFSENNKYFAYVTDSALHIYDQLTMKELFKAGYPGTSDDIAIALEFIDDNNLVLRNGYHDTYHVYFDKNKIEYRPLFVLSPIYECNISANGNIQYIMPSAGYLNEIPVCNMTILNKDLNVIGYVGSYRLQTDTTFKETLDNLSWFFKNYKDNNVIYASSWGSNNYLINKNFYTNERKVSTEKYTHKFMCMETFDSDSKGIFANADGKLYIYSLDSLKLLSIIEPNYQQSKEQQSVYRISKIINNTFYYLYSDNLLQNLLLNNNKSVVIGKYNMETGISEDLDDISYNLTTKYYYRFTFTNDNKYLIYFKDILQSGRNELIFIDLESNQVQRTLKVESNIISINVSPDSKLLAIGGRDKTVIYDIEKNIYIDSVLHHTSNNKNVFKTLSATENLFHYKNLFDPIDDIIYIFTKQGDIIKYKFDRVVSVENYPQNDLMTNVIPNPNDGKFDIQLEDNQFVRNIKLYNYLGIDLSEQLIYNFRDQNKINFELLNPISGVYFVEITTQINKYYIKVLIR